MKITDLYDDAAIDDRITEWGKTAQGVQDEAHKLACSVLRHVLQHRDTRVVLRLIQAVPDAIRVNALKQWFEAFSPVRFSEDTVSLDKHHKQTKGLGDALDKPFWKFKAKEGVPYTALILEDFLIGQIKRLQKDIKEAPAPAGTIDIRGGILNGLRASLTAVLAQSTDTAEGQGNAVHGASQGTEEAKPVLSLPAPCKANRPKRTRKKKAA